MKISVLAMYSSSSLQQKIALQDFWPVFVLCTDKTVKTHISWPYQQGNDILL